MPGDPEFPYVGKLVKDLTVTQLSMLDCGTRRPVDPRDDPVVDTQIPSPMPASSSSTRCWRWSTRWAPVVTTACD